MKEDWRMKSTMVEEITEEQTEKIAVTDSQLRLLFFLGEVMKMGVEGMETKVMYAVYNTWVMVGLRETPQSPEDFEWDLRVLESLGAISPWTDGETLH